MMEQHQRSVKMKIVSFYYIYDIFVCLCISYYKMKYLEQKSRKKCRINYMTNDRDKCSSFITEKNYRLFCVETRHLLVILFINETSSIGYFEYR